MGDLGRTEFVVEQSKTTLFVRTLAIREWDKDRADGIREGRKPATWSPSPRKGALSSLYLLSLLSIYFPFPNSQSYAHAYTTQTSPHARLCWRVLCVSLQTVLKDTSSPDWRDTATVDLFSFQANDFFQAAPYRPRHFFWDMWAAVHKCERGFLQSFEEDWSSLFWRRIREEEGKVLKKTEGQNWMFPGLPAFTVQWTLGTRDRLVEGPVSRMSRNLLCEDPFYRRKTIHLGLT